MPALAGHTLLFHAEALLKLPLMSVSAASYLDDLQVVDTCSICASNAGMPLTAERRMPWNDKVLDNLEQIYWSPDKIGLRSIKQQPSPDGAGFFVPKDRLVGADRSTAGDRRMPTGALLISTQN